MQPRYDFMADAHTRLRDYHQAAVEAHTDQRGIYQPNVQAALAKGGLYRWRPTDKDRPGDPVAKAMNLGGTGLLVSGNSGLFRALGPAGSAAAKVWNAALAAGGAWQNKRQGVKNAKGKVYKAPKEYPTEFERRQAERRRRKAALPTESNR